MRTLLIVALVAATHGREGWPALEKALAEYPKLHARELDKLSPQNNSRPTAVATKGERKKTSSKRKKTSEKKVIDAAKDEK